MTCTWGQGLHPRGNPRQSGVGISSSVEMIWVGFHSSRSFARAAFTYSAAGLPSSGETTEEEPKPTFETTDSGCVGVLAAVIGPLLAALAVILVAVLPA